jgi:hypothetical protein
MLKRFKDLLIPHEGNDFRPDILERVSVGVMLILILLSFAMANIQSLLWIGSDWLVSTILPSVIVDLTNDERGTESLLPLKRNETLDAAAKMKAEDMAKNSYFAHYSPEGVSPWYWFDQAGYDYLNAGENLAVHFTESSEVVEAWMDSPSHRANIMSGQYQEIGVGTAKGEYKGSPTIFVVQLFGTARAQATTESTVAGTSTENTSTPITIEKVAARETEFDVAPATVSEEIPTQEEKVVVPADPVMNSPLTSEEAQNELKDDTKDDMEIVPENDTEFTETFLYTSLATTSRDGEPAIPASTEQTINDDVPIPVRSATESGLWLQVIYTILALVVILSLVVSLAVEWHSHHPVQIAYASGLLVVMALLLYVHEMLTGHVLIV